MKLFYDNMENYNYVVLNKIPVFSTYNFRFDAQFFDDMYNLILQKGNDYFKYLLDTVGVKYSELDSNSLRYKVDDKWLLLYNLSTGESMFLLALVCRDIGRKVILIGALECLSVRKINKFITELLDSDCVGIFVLSNRVLLGKCVKLECDEYVNQF